MMKYSKCIYLILLSVIATCNRIPGKASCGTQIIHMMPGTRQTIPDQLLFYYGNYVVEPLISIRQSSVNGLNASISYDTTYYLINCKDSLFVSYGKFNERATHGDMSGLSEKKNGINFYQAIDPTLDYSPHLPVKDTLLDGKSTKYFTIHTKSSPLETVICYFDFTQNPPFHFNRQIDADYKGTVVRIDMTDEKGEAQGTIAMTIQPNSLTQHQIAVIRSWIKSNNWKE